MIVLKLVSKRNQVIVGQTTNRELVMDGVAHLPALPSAALKIIELTNDLSSSPKDLMDVIKIDPVLTGKILNLVNSSYFSMPQRITSLNRALILLGFNTIKNIAISTAFIDASKTLKKLRQIDDLWEHMLAVGVASKMIAIKAGQPRKILEEFFIAGLLHDIGDLMLFRFAPEQTLEALKEDNDFVETCKKELDLTGPECGEAVIRHWKLPDSFIDVVHHRERAGEQADVIINAVNLANHLISSLDIGLVTDKTHQAIPENMIKALQISPYDLQEITENLPAEIEKAQVFMDTPS